MIGLFVAGRSPCVSAFRCVHLFGSPSPSLCPRPVPVPVPVENAVPSKFRRIGLWSPCPCSCSNGHLPYRRIPSFTGGLDYSRLESEILILWPSIELLYGNDMLSNRITMLLLCCPYHHPAANCYRLRPSFIGGGLDSDRLS